MEDERSLGQIVGDLSNDLTTLVKQELELARTELKEEAAKAGKGAGMLGGAGVAGLLALILGSFALAYLLDNWMPVELAFLIVTAPVGDRRRRPRGQGPQGAQERKPAAAGDAADTQGGRSMGQSTEELRSEIEQTRQSMTADVDALQDRVSPSAIVERRKQAARSRVLGVRDKVMGTAHGVSSSASGTAGSAKDSAGGAVDSVKGTAQDAVSGAQDKVQGAPLAAGLVAFGAGVIVAALIPASEKEAVAAGHVVDAAKEHGQPVVDQAKSVAQDVVDGVKETAAEAAQEVKDTASDSAGKVKSEGQSGVDEVRSQTQS